MYEFSMSFFPEGFPPLEPSSHFLAPKLLRNQCVFVRCCLDTFVFLSKQPIICKRALLTCVLVVVHHVYPTLRIVSKFVILPRFL